VDALAATLGHEILVLDPIVVVISHLIVVIFHLIVVQEVHFLPLQLFDLALEQSGGDAAVVCVQQLAVVAYARA